MVLRKEVDRWEKRMHAWIEERESPPGGSRE